MKKYFFLVTLAVPVSYYEPAFSVTISNGTVVSRWPPNSVDPALISDRYMYVYMYAVHVVTVPTCVIVCVCVSLCVCVCGRH